jgi:uncharacterized protein YpiB (UPF0302 family)
MEKKLFKPEFKPDNSDEIQETAEEALKLLKKYPKSVTEQPKINDGSIEISEQEVKPEDLKEAIDEALEAIEKKKAA